MTIVRHERFHALAEQPDYERAGATAVGARAAAISLTGLEKSFGANRVLRGINLHIPAGQFVAVIGKSGCGKSTLLRLLMGLDAPSAGELRFEGADGATASPNTRIVFQEPRLLPWLSVADNVAIGLGDGINAQAALEAAGVVLADVQLGEKAREWPAKLSGGQRQRVALARALVSRPGVLALDEPLGALDALTRISMQELINRVWRDLGFTAVLVTHDVSEAVHLADRVIVLDEGRVALDLAIPYPHPRRHGHSGLAELEGQLLAAILGSDARQ
ncbi:ATP-binding cassette domain-containing protein [Rhizobium lentis]|uniref:ATP-binding cassette domain-containing protein n=1 Tax=Rhizobium lentis TaxID=1138194 RepID=A0A9Q3M7N0_9HYPH|nr:ATP-binding cassette domain-containing protein [Rhizobium lentis]MBX4954616.1 ATP-binding cassette domain-containing protein [Rhizobium lentis]MBX4971859.1 ATP-binding cassette domain-containing protein [Rhizobium lentis]MBX4984623.1 ATP-binding cassette domain-containing protein [Rhizobium lentis]MBX4996386.1 ATP-binding cassette domain-containing protein [Rhizobium lentis]MBX5002398.1 ATP-binding cassette domain-containing protein [Rhizobium lentis]